MTYKRRDKDTDILSKGVLTDEELKSWIGEIFYGEGTMGFHFPADAFSLWVNEVINRHKETVDNKFDKLILAKVLHTKEVVDAGLDIMTRTGEIDWDQYKVCTVTLLHDIGRFQQALLGSFSDTDTNFDHASYGADLVEKANLREMEKMGVNLSVVVESVRMHSRISYEGDDIYVKLTRDADKLAILRYMPYLMSLASYPHGKASDKNLNSFRSGEMIKNVDRVNYADVLLSCLCWESDFNFDATKKAFREDGIRQWIVDELKKEAVEV